MGQERYKIAFAAYHSCVPEQAKNLLGAYNSRFPEDERTSMEDVLALKQGERRIDPSRDLELILEDLRGNIGRRETMQGMTLAVGQILYATTLKSAYDNGRGLPGYEKLVQPGTMFMESSKLAGTKSFRDVFQSLSNEETRALLKPGNAKKLLARFAPAAPQDQIQKVAQKGGPVLGG